MAEEKGVWRTVRGRRIWIGEGQDLYDAMQKSGKFKNLGKRGAYQASRSVTERSNAELVDDYKKGNRELKKVNRSRYNIDSMHEKDKNLENDRMYKPKHNTAEANRARKLGYRDYEKKRQEELVEKLATSKLNSPEFEKAKRDMGGTLEYNKSRTDNYKVLKSREKEGKLDVYEKEMLDYRKKEIEDYRARKGKNDLERQALKAKELGNGRDYTTTLDDGRKLEYVKMASGDLYELTEKDGTRLRSRDGKNWEHLNGYKKKEEKVNKGPFNTYAEEREAMQQKKALENPQDKNKVVFKQRDSMYGGEFEYTQEEIDRMAKGKIRPMKDSYGHRGAWEGINRGNYSNKEIGQKVNEYMKKEHPGVKLSRSTTGYNSVEFRIMSSDKPLTVSEADIDKMNFSDFGRLSASNNFEWWAKDNIPGYTQRRVYSIDDVRRYAKTLIKDGYKGRNVSHDDWYLTEYGKKVVSDLQTELDSYNYDDSNGMVDYFNSGFYDSVSLGTWSKPYQNGNVSKKQATIDNYKRRKGK